MIEAREYCCLYISKLGFCGLISLIIIDFEKKNHWNGLKKQKKKGEKINFQIFLSTQFLFTQRTERYTYQKSRRSQNTYFIWSQSDGD